MLRRIALYVLIGALAYAGFLKYNEHLAHAAEERAAAERERARKTLEEQNANASVFERALRRRESTEHESKDVGGAGAAEKK